MAEYSALLKQILNVPQLVQQVKTFAADHQAINLVTVDWKERLENDKTFQEFQRNAREKFQPERSSYNNVFRVQKLKDSAVPLRVIVAGYCKMYKSTGETPQKKQLSIIMEESPVMDMLNKTFTNDMDPNLFDLNLTTKVNFKPCNMYCQDCRNSKKDMIAQGYSVKFDCPQPCISTMLIFDGIQAKNRFGSQILNQFVGSFLTILKMEFDVRYSYHKKDMVSKKRVIRTGGNVINMVCFPESNLKTTKVDLGDLDAASELETEVSDNYMPEEMKFNDILAPEPEEMMGLGKKRSREEDDEEDVDDDSVIDVIPSNEQKKQKSWEDEFSVLEDTLEL